MTAAPDFGALSAAAARGDHTAVIRLAGEILAQRPGDDAAYELRARALQAMGRLDEAEADAKAAVRLDPDEIRYRELLAHVLSAAGAHREAAEEYARLARLDPRQPEWIRAEAAERLASADAEAAVEAARRALRLDPNDVAAQLALAHGLLRAGQAHPALEAAHRAVALAPGDPKAREAEADARWLAGDESGALAAYAALAREGPSEVRDGALDRARALYRSRAGFGGRMLAALRPLFAAALRADRLRLPRPAAASGGSAPRPPGPRP
ncbi:MAG TPA: tetratricopeptide repeat protein [Candidatus Limnocylindria bacterium]